MGQIVINCALFKPGMLETMDIDEISLKVPTFDSWIIGGEHVPAHMSVGCEKRVKRLRMAYGSAESGVASFVAHAISEIAAARTMVTGEIGLPLSHIQYWITKKDDFNTLADTRKIGELVLGSPIWGRGYLGDPRQTAYSFVHYCIWDR